MQKETVRQLTLVKVLVGMIKLTGNFNHFDKSDAGKAAMRQHVTDTGMWWAGYSNVFADVRVNILVAAQVVKDHFPGMLQGFPKLTSTALEVLQTVIPMLEQKGAEDNIPATIRDEYSSEAYWQMMQAKLDNFDKIRFEMINLETDRKKNPGRVKIGQEWLEYGTVFKDQNDLDLVVINHTIVPQEQLRVRATTLENTLAVMSEADRKPAVDLITSLGGTMFAAICRAGFKAIEQAVAECVKEGTPNIGMRRDSLNAEQGFVVPDSSGIEVNDQTVNRDAAEVIQRLHEIRGTEAPAVLEDSELALVVLGRRYYDYREDPKQASTDRVNSRWQSQWDTDNIYSPWIAVNLLWAEVHVLDSNPLTTVEGPRYFVSVPNGEFVVVYPETLEKFNAIMQVLKVVLRTSDKAVMAINALTLAEALPPESLFSNGKRLPVGRVDASDGGQREFTDMSKHPAPDLLLNGQDDIDPKA